MKEKAEKGGRLYYLYYLRAFGENVYGGDGIVFVNFEKICERHTNLRPC